VDRGCGIPGIDGAEIGSKEGVIREFGRRESGMEKGVAGARE